MSESTSSARPVRKGSDRWGNSMTALCGGALALNLLLIIGLLVLIASKGLGYFWQKPVVELVLEDGTRLLGEINLRQETPRGAWKNSTQPEYRIRMKVGNRDLTGADFVWVDESAIHSRETPADALLLERLEWGNFYGRLVAVEASAGARASGAEISWKTLAPLLEAKERERAALHKLEKGAIGDVNAAIERLRLQEKALALRDLSAEEVASRKGRIDERLTQEQARYDALSSELFAQREALMREILVVRATDGAEKRIPAGAVVRAVRPNELGFGGRLALYLSRVWEFVAGDPRESNTEGGIFPAIFGTVMMVFLMSLVVTPFGVLAALYLREYAKQGPLVRVVRIAVNNLAGVPSIVFGMFGLGFFVYGVGGTIDRWFFPEALPTPTFGTGGILWAALTLALLTVPVVIVATEEGLAAVPRIVREGSLALGATKFETTWRVVVPAAAPGILTGMILAMARAAGEVAPLMIVGMVKLAPALPIDHHAPFVHFERKFMHLGFHIFDVGFQSPNIEATTPLVFATALLLIAVVTAMNLVAIAIRNHLRRKYRGSAV